MVADLSALWQTVIGAAAAILGGAIAMPLQGWITERIRRREREEEALLEIDGLLARLATVVRLAAENASDHERTWPSPFWRKAHADIGLLSAAWAERLQARIRPASVREAEERLMEAALPLVGLTEVEAGTLGEAREMNAKALALAPPLRAAIAELRAAVAKALP